MTDFQQQIIDEFRSNAGQVGGWFKDADMLLLTTTGARSGRPHTVPLVYLTVDGRTILVASAGGAPANPAWFHNLRANPQVTIEIGTDTRQATAELPADRDALFAKVVELAPGYADYQTKTDRKIPVVELHF